MGLRKRPYNEDKKKSPRNQSEKPAGKRAPKLEKNTGEKKNFTNKKSGPYTTKKSSGDNSHNQYGRKKPARFNSPRVDDTENTKKNKNTFKPAKPRRFNKEEAIRDSKKQFRPINTDERKKFSRDETKLFQPEGYKKSKSGRPYMVKGAKARDLKEKSEEMLEASLPEIVRLNRYISNAGICSRREADNLIAAGLVQVNGEIVTEMGYKVKPGDEIRYNNTRLKWEKKVYLLMNKPKDTITTSDDPEGRKIIMDLIKEPRLPRVYPVGRLDRNTTGVILLTNDGELSQRLTHPKYNVTKVYKAVLNKSFLSKDLHDVSANGVDLEDGNIKPDVIGIPSASEKNVVLVQIHSGRNRIIHRMFEALGYLVDKLDRLEFAGFDRKGLDRGEWRHLDEKEIKKLKKLVQMK